MKIEDTRLSLIAEINLACDTLGLYRAELARILGLMCQDVSDSRTLEKLLQEDRHYQQRAELFILLFHELEKRFKEDNVATLNWFRRHNANLETTPFSCHRR